MWTERKSQFASALDDVKDDLKALAASDSDGEASHAADVSGGFGASIGSTAEPTIKVTASADTESSPPQFQYEADHTHVSLTPQS